MLVISIVCIAFVAFSIIIIFACCKVAGDCSRMEEQFEEQIRQAYEEWKKERQKETKNNSAYME